MWTSIAKSRLQLADSLSSFRGGHALKFGADFNNIRNTAKWDLFFPARVIFASLGGRLSWAHFLNQTPVVFWWALVNGTTTRPPLPIPFTQDVPTELEPLTKPAWTTIRMGSLARMSGKRRPS